MPDVFLPLYIDFGATFLFAVTGAMFAIRRHYDWVGAFVLALCSGLGGGLLRDGLFINNGAPVAMRHPGYIWAVIAGCIAAGLFHQFVGKLDRLFLYADALGLGMYGVVGTTKASVAGLSLPAAIFVGVVNAVGGSIIRDVLTNTEPLLFKARATLCRGGAGGLLCLRCGDGLAATARRGCGSDWHRGDLCGADAIDCI